MKPLLALACVLLAAAPARAWTETPAARRAEYEADGFILKGGGSFSYEDNVHDFSPEDGDERNGNDITVSGPVQARHDRLVTVDDGIYHQTASFFEQSRIFGDSLTHRFGFEIDHAMHTQNDIKDHPTLRAMGRQYLTQAQFFEAYYRVVLNRFDRNFLGKTETARRFPGIHNERSAGAVWDGRFGLLDAGVRYEYSWIKYAEPQLSYRNSDVRTLGGNLGWRWRPWLHTMGLYGFERAGPYGARTWDGAYQEHQWGLIATFSPARAWEVSAEYRGAFRRYTSRLGVGVDPFHSGRRDFRDEVALGGAYRLGGHWRFWARWLRADNRTNVPYQLSDESLRYLKHSYSAGVETTWTVDFLTPE